MELKSFRFSHGNEDTLGLLFVDCDFECYTLEDEHRTEKVRGETRIPAGVYEVGLRTVGGFHNRYLKRYGEDFHKGMLELKNVPDFKYILIHAGNDDDDTDGCILVGDTANNNQIADGFISHSRNAYKRLYAKVIAAMERGESVHYVIEEA